MPKSERASRDVLKQSSADLTAAEWTIMKVVWENEPCAAGTVQEVLTDTRGWAYSTVKTTMDRMVRKGFLRVERIRNLNLFRSRITEIDAKRGELYRMLKRAFDGALTPMMHFLVEHENLSKDEIRQLRKLVSEAKKRKS